MFESFLAGNVLPSGINIVFIMVAFMIAIVGAIALLAAHKKKKESMLMYMIEEAKERDLPIIVPLDLAGHGSAYLGTFDDPADIKFEGIPFGLQIRPSLLEKAYPISLFGVRWYFYVGNMYYPSNFKDAFVLSFIMEEFRKHYPQANFIDNSIEIINMLCVDNAEDLRYNAGLAIETYEQEEYAIDEHGNYIPETIETDVPVLDDNGEETGEYETITEPKYNNMGEPVYLKNDKLVTEADLYGIIKRAKETIFNKKMRSGFVHVKDAVNLIPFSMDGLIMDRIVKITEQKVEARLANEKGMPWWAILVIAIFAIIAGSIALVWFGNTLLPIAT